MLRKNAATCAVMAAMIFATLSEGALARSAYRVRTYERERQLDWRLDIARYPFRGTMLCTLRARNNKVFFTAGALAFRFKRKLNTADAVYRVDNGDPRASRDDLPALITLGAPIDRGGMENPTQGLVWIPLTMLEDADNVSIAPRFDRKAKTFQFRGFKELHQIALSRGCSPRDGFAEP